MSWNQVLSIKEMGMVKDDVFDSLIKYEDLAWVDSCLVEDPTIAPEDWSCMKDALWDILSSESETASSLKDDHRKPVSEKSESVDLFKDKGGDYIIFREEGESSRTMEHDDDEDDDEDDDKDAEADVKDICDYYNIGGYRSAKAKRGLKKALRQSSSDNFFTSIEVNSGSSSGTGLLLTGNEMATPSDDIFKVWDLGISVEEDEFSKQMNKLLADNEEDSYVWEGATSESVNSLVHSMAELSLKQA